MRLAGILLVATLAVAAAAVGALRAAAGEAGAQATRVKVGLKEFVVAPSPRSARAGKVAFAVRNTGKLPHELIVVKTNRPAAKLPVKGSRAVTTGRVAAVPPLKPGKSRTLTATLKAGKYVLLCNLPGHYQAGQRTGFRVG